MHPWDHAYISVKPLTAMLPPINVGIGNDTSGRSRSSLQLLEVNDFLLGVKEKFSEVLLPVESITKQGLLGKGYKDYT